MTKWVWMLLLPAWAWAAPKTKISTWQEIRSEHFLIISEAGLEMTLPIVERLEQFHGLLAALKDPAQPQLSMPTEVYVFKGDRSFRNYRNWRVDLQRSGQSFYLAHERGNFIAINANSRRERSHQSVYREMVMAFSEQNFPFIPSWLVEGLAEYFKTYSALEREIRVAAPIKDHIAKLRAQGVLPLEKLFRMKNSDDSFENKRDLFSANAWALVHYILSGNPELRDRFPRMIENFAKGMSVSDALRKGLDFRIEDLEQAVKAYIGGNDFPVFSLSFEVPTDGFATRELRSEEVWFHLGQLLAHAGPSARAAARNHFQRAIQINPEYPESYLGLALLETDAKRFDVAETLLKKAYDLGSQKSLTYLLYGSSLLKHQTLNRPPTQSQEPWLEARFVLQKGLNLFPNLGLGEMLLGNTYLYDPMDPEKGLSHFQKARDLLPNRTEVLFQLTLLQIKLERFEDAQTTIEGPLKTSGDQVLLDRARNALAEAQLAGQIDGAITDGNLDLLEELFERAKTQWQDEHQLNRVAQELDRLRLEESKRLVQERFNRAVQLFNEGRIKLAQSELETLLVTVKDGSLRTGILNMLTRIETAKND